MVKSLILIGIVATIFLVTILVKNKKNKKLKSMILIIPFALAGVIYLSIMLLTKDMSPEVCDGAAIVGILFSFILIGMGLLLNLVNIIYWVIKSKSNI